MPISIPDRVIVFDYGEVISVTPTEADRAALVAIADVDPDLFWPSYWRHRNGLDEGTLAITDYWQLVASDVGAQFSDTKIHQLWVSDFRSWLSADADTLDVLFELRAGRTRMALLSNAGRDFSSYFRHGPLGALFEGVFVSGELGIIKPAAKIFRHVMGKLAISAAQMVFVDNKEENVRGAEALGITGHVYTDAAHLRAFLESLGTAR
ncbi:HAD family hydrolase [Rathayibacter soli]|uniref:HAD family hydrolase n=1 Tax=Rathayibacter soli TaxID=3144168 RepID=UPI0027E3C790|nr:HAD family phosphatase [Glaciibacter superstes]